MTRADFQRAFLRTCLADGLTLDQIVDRAEKTAAHADKLAGAGSEAPSLVNPSLVRDFGVPFAAAAGLGALGSHLKGNWTDEEDVKKQEVLAELRRQTAMLRRNRNLHARLAVR
jgi:hypothetical protein